MARFTILGSSGFIGSHLASSLRQAGHELLTPGRDDPAIFNHELGHVIYCIGLTADFRTRPYDTVRAHVCLLADILERSRFDSLLYLSSTRVYQGAGNGAEDAPLLAGDLYNLTKLAGESLCLASGRANARVARLSNVVGGDWHSDNFLFSIIRSALEDGKIELRSALDSAKDYVAIEDVVGILPSIALNGLGTVYNVASGRNVRNQELVEKIREMTGCMVTVVPGAPCLTFPAIEIGRLKQEFAYEPIKMENHLVELVERFKTMMRNEGQT